MSKNTPPDNIGSSAASGNGHWGAAVKSQFFPVEALFVSMRLRSWFANAGMFDTVDSKSKSNPSTTALPNGRGAEELEEYGPKSAQMLFAAVTAAEEVLKPPSL